MKNQILEPEKFQEGSRLYFYSVRYLLERISWYLRDNQHLIISKPGKCELIFSNRATMSYEELKNYLLLLERQKQYGVKNIQINFDYFDLEDGFSTFTPGRRAGLQIVDACAGAMFNALELNRYGFRESRYIEILSPILYRYVKKLIGYGIKFVPREAIIEIRKDPELSRILGNL